MGSLTRRWLLCRQHRFQFRLRWNDDPCDQVGNDARTDSGGERDEDAYDAHQRYVEIVIMSQAGTDAGDLSVGAGAHKFPGHGRDAHHRAAVGTKADVLSDVLAARVAVHGVPLSSLGYEDFGEDVPHFGPRGLKPFNLNALNGRAEAAP